MTAPRRFSATMIAAALATLSAPAFAAEVIEITTTTPGYYSPPVTYTAPATTYYYTEPATTYYYTEPAPSDTYYAAPVTDHSVVVADRYYYEPPIVVTAPRATDDDLITGDVVDRLASDPRVSGNIGVDTFNRNVTLTGRVASPVQKDYAEQDAKGVDG